MNKASNIIFLGSVDNGKSTLAGRILVTTGAVTQQEIEKCKRLAKDKKMDSWYLAYLLDSSEEEQLSGKTNEVGTTFFSWKDKRYNILDAPGHSAYIPKMVYALSMADVAVVLISARSNEFESSLKGSLVEHLSLAKVMGVSNIVVAINKMDCCPDQARVDVIEKDTRKLCRKFGYQQVEVVKISAYQDVGIDTLLDTLNNIIVQPIKIDDDFRMSVAIVDQCNVYGKIYQGSVEQGQRLLVVPSHQEVTVKEVHDDHLVISSSHVKVGDFLVSGQSVREAKSLLVDCYALEFLVTGTRCMLHVHTATIPCEIKIVGSPIIRERKKAKIIIVPDTPVFVEKGTRYSNIALRGQNTLAIGTIVGIKY